MSDFEYWWQDETTQRVWKRLVERQAQIARALVLASPSAQLDELRLMAGEYRGITLALSEFQAERRET